ncbi:hypothetical protein ACFFJT_13445 [Dyella flava]|uniref:Polymer-forming cytoskeletal protein n=1 Tax=Dyella flava TaxID=1920170 RepID=A0ABS2K0P9_9GAMM|nr:hypothetical protein [Dyella flava]MBM7124333.1 hypothetical protein [Dyella flava]GLQ52416.1 hypothetical protein GCM10010872_38650 [Dyella flava]
MRLVALALALLLPLAAAAQDIDKVNGTIDVGPGEHAGDVHTVNGSVHIGGGAIVQTAGTVNGSVDLGDKAQASGLHTVNGHIALNEGSRVSGNIKTTNGGISMESRADVAGNVTTVNGSIGLNHAHVGNGIETTSGDITVGDGSRVEGGILVNEPHGWSWPNHDPHIVIGPHAVVTGTLDFRRPVQLDVSDSAQIGPVKGAKPNIFHGATPSM